jgi:hypothetical protein
MESVINTNKNKELAVTGGNEIAEVKSGYALAGANLNEILSEELDGLTLSFDRIKVPAGGGLTFALPSENPDDPDMAKEVKAVILYHHPIHSYYREKYTGGNEAPDCGSLDGHTGVEAEGGEIKVCKDCEYNKFGSGENGAKACKQKRRIYILREGEALPIILSLPTGSLAEFSKYVMRLLSKGQKTSGVVTKFTLKKAQNAGGISYSQVVCAADRVLLPDEQAAIERLSEQVKRFAGKVGVAESDGE